MCIEQLSCRLFSCDDCIVLIGKFSNEFYNLGLSLNRNTIDIVSINPFIREIPNIETSNSSIISGDLRSPFLLNSWSENKAQGISIYWINGYGDFLGDQWVDVLSQNNRDSYRNSMEEN
jgi:hypothetical protein